MIKWPERARAAIKKLFEPLQDIDVYIEDTNDEAFYRTLLNNITKGDFSIARVFALGGKIPVIEAAKIHDHSTRRALFIIDGDLDWVRGDPPQGILGLHQHEAYCIENLLVCEKALCQILAQEAVITEDEARHRLGFSEWIKSIQTPLLELFSAYATVQKIAPSEKTVGNGVGTMCTKQRNGGRVALDVHKVRAAVNQSLTAAELNSDKTISNNLYKQTLARVQALAIPLRSVSGKDFILPLLDFLLQSHGCRIKRKTLRMRLASGGDLGRFSDLSASLYKAAHGF